MEAAFAPKAALFIAAERRRRVELVERVSPDDTRAQLRGDLEILAAFVGPDPGRETIRSVVGFFHRLVGRPECEDGQYRTEDFFARDAVRHGDAGEERGA